MTFTERFEQLQKAFRAEADGFAGIPALKELKYVSSHDTHALYKVTLHADGRRTIPLIVSACPDRFSFPEAARFVGYPFRTMVGAWENMVKRWPAKSGPLHVVMIYRNVTDTQIRRHLGNPDIRVAHEPWGFFARDPERFIQSLYLVNCRDPISVHERVHEGLGWLADPRRLTEIASRAEGRGKILEARRLSGD